MITIPKTLPKEIKDKYSVLNNTFRLDKIENPEDIINAEIGFYNHKLK